MQENQPNTVKYCKLIYTFHFGDVDKGCHNLCMFHSHFSKGVMTSPGHCEKPLDSLGLELFENTVLCQRKTRIKYRSTELLSSDGVPRIKRKISLFSFSSVISSCRLGHRHYCFLSGATVSWGTLLMNLIL